MRQTAHGCRRLRASESTLVGGREGAASRRLGPPERREAGQGREADPEMRAAVIYVLRDPRTGIAMYVGKTTRDPKERLEEHIWVSPLRQLGRWLGRLHHEGLW